MRSRVRSSEAPDDAPLLAGRYQLVAPIGRGGHGTVWRAVDRLSGEAVAVKRWDVDGTAAPRIRREVAALRLLRVPGVVRLLDEGDDERGAFLVMELVEGEAFPGRPKPTTWSALEDTVTALLETLARVHARGVVHRDLKPSNVFVDGRGRPTLLDFGIASSHADASITGAGQRLGTPAYQSPELLRGDAVGAGADLYAVGTMIFEALAGARPFAELPPLGMVYARVFQPVPSLRAAAPDAPEHVVAAVDAMLQRDPDDRPRSAAHAMELLRGGASLPPCEDEPTVSDAGAIRAVVERAREGRCVVLVGPREADCARTLRAAARALAVEGRAVVYANASTAPFASLSALVGSIPASLDDLAAVTAWVREQMRTRLAQGVILVVDDEDRVDRWSREVLDRAPREGAVLRARSAGEGDGVVRARPLDEEALRALIAGPSRVMHLPEDAARLLRARTDAWAPAVERELRAWVRAGLARWDGERVALRREDLDRIGSSGARAAPSTATGPRSSSLPRRQLDLVAWVTLAWPHATPELLAVSTGSARWELEASLDELLRAGAVRREAGGRFVAEVPVAVGEVWPDARRAEAHRALARALPAGAEGRLAHLIAASDGGSDALDAVAEEGVSAARRHLEAGRLGLAEATLREAVLELRRRPDEGDRSLPLLAAWADVALASGTPHALDRVLYEVCRVREGGAPHRQIETLLRAALASRSTGAHALALADSLAPFDDPTLDLWRQSVRVVAARRCSLDDEVRVVSEAETWAERAGTREAAASLAAWRARLCYRQERFDAAAARWLDAARDEPRPERRLSAMTGAASALMEAARLDEAQRVARAALDEARATRHTYFEARAEWLLRATRYRMGVASEVDRELVDAVASVGVSDLEALTCLTEAAVAWRAGAFEACAELADRVVALWSRSGWTWPLVLPKCLALAARGDAGEDVDALVARVDECPVASVAIQALALLAMAAPRLRAVVAPALRGHAARIDVAMWDARMEVVSVREALACVDATERAPRSDALAGARGDL